MMGMKTFTAKEIDGENGIFVETGTATFEFDAKADNTDMHFVVKDVKKIDAKYVLVQALYAINTVDFAYCGYFDRMSVKNIREVI